jgi:hypothetical protein
MPYAHLLLADACRHAGRPHRADAARAAAEAAERSLTVRFHRAPAVACPGAGGAGLNTC